MLAAGNRDEGEGSWDYGGGSREQGLGEGFREQGLYSMEKRAGRQDNGK